MTGGYQGNGTFQFTYQWTQDAANGIPITASRMDQEFADATSGFDNVICRDGQSTTTALIPFANGASFGASIVYGGITLANSVAGTGSMTLETDGTWTPADNSGNVVFVSSAGFYRKIGKTVLIYGSVVYPSTADGSQASIKNLPFAASASVPGGYPSINIFGPTVASIGVVAVSATTFGAGGLATGTALQNANWSTATVYFSGVYPTDT